jgi:hypothetical protein
MICKKCGKEIETNEEFFEGTYRPPVNTQKFGCSPILVWHAACFNQPERSKREDPHFNIQDFPDDITADELKVFMLGMENKIVGCGALNSMET